MIPTRATASPPVARSVLSGRARVLAVLLFLAFAALLMLRALVAPDNHDEAQYAGAAILAGQAVPYRDFLILQPPLHALVYAPLGWLAPGHAYTAMRVATALMGLLALLVVHRAARAAGASPVAAVLAAAAMAACGAFQFTATIVRNDMLPTLLSAAGMWAALRAIAPDKDGAEPRAALAGFAAGLLFGLAAATKLSFAPLAAAPLAALGRRARSLYLAGLLAGIAPALVYAAQAPEPFFYGVFDFALTAPAHWYAANGLGHEMGLPAKAWDLARALAKGPSPLAMLLVAMAAWRHKRTMPSQRGRLLTALVLAGALGAALPTPTHLPYIMPLLPSLYVAAALALTRDPPRRATAMLLGLLAAGFAVNGSTRSLELLQEAHGWTAPTIDAQARGISRILTAQGIAGPVATLSTHRVASTTAGIDRRFATGPFVYRSGTLIRVARAERLHAATPAGLRQAFDEAPPAAILTGYEGLSEKFDVDPDRGLIHEARVRGFRPWRMPDGIGTLWIAPARLRSGARP